MAVAERCECGSELTAEDIDAFSEVFLAHVRAEHADWPYPDVAVRNVGAGMIRMQGERSERFEEIGTVAVHRVTEDRVDDWLDLFDHRVSAGFAPWSACYCLEPHELQADGTNPGMRPWRERRAAMIERLRAGTTVGFLAYVDGVPAGWVNASARRDYSLFRQGDADDDCTVGVSCFAIAPPYRGHGLAKMLLDRVLEDAASRGAEWVEAYPFNAGRGNDNPDFRGPRAMYDERGFTEVKVRARDTVVRRPAD
jgi:GNAT superfamily N-acetyltransferase